jgi:hypothetical protein
MFNKFLNNAVSGTTKDDSSNIAGQLDYISKEAGLNKFYSLFST